jgi:pimeloyl-ACP methyl ester carboxylesterase
MSNGSDQRRLLGDVEEAFATLPQRYLGADPGTDACVHVRLDDVGRTWEVRLTETDARVGWAGSMSPGRAPDVVIGTDAVTWMALRRGELSGVEAFMRRDVHARGDVDLAVGFEGMFRLPNGREPLLRMHDVRLPGRTVSVLTMGEGPDVLLLHGLGGTKSSFFETAGALARGGYRVHALDFPGFGASSKPLTAPYTAAWFAATVLETMDAMGIDGAFLVGNSMGGRVAIEVAMLAPERIDGIGLLCPAVAFVKRQFHPIVRLMRPEVSLLPHAIPRALVARQFWSLFQDRDAIDPAVADVAVDGFRKIYGSPGARHAFLASARNLYLDEPWGRRGFYARLSDLEVPALFVWGSHDKLIPASFSRIVAEWLPEARQVVLDGCGHVPQVERSDEVNAMLSEFFAGCPLPQVTRLPAAA